MQHYCNCHNTLTLKQGVTGLMDEVKEFIEEPSQDEFSDIVYCLNRLAGTLLNRPYVKVIPGDQPHVSKIKKRMQEYNCIRSSRHLINGKCPSEVDSANS